MVESQPSKLLVAGSIPVSRSKLSRLAGVSLLAKSRGFCARDLRFRTMTFEQAAIKIEKEAEFEELKAAIVRAFAPQRVETTLKQIRSAGRRVRDFEGLLAKRVLEKVDGGLGKSGKGGEGLYGALTLSDQAQMREFYLAKLEEVSPELRAKFHKLYQYY